VTPEQLSQTILDALAALVEGGQVRLGELPEEVRVERPRSREHGDYATNVAMQLGKRAGMKPAELAGLLVARLERA
jgi:arginyl-tRNA synthetase